MVSCVQDGRCRKSIAERPSLLVWSGLVWSGLVWKVGVAGRFVQDPNRYLRSVMVSHPQSTVPPTPKQTQAPGPRSWGFVLECGVEAWGRASTAGRCAPPVSCVTSPKHAGHSGGLGGEPPPELPEVRECAAGSIQPDVTLLTTLGTTPTSCHRIRSRASIWPQEGACTSGGLFCLGERISLLGAWWVAVYQVLLSTWVPGYGEQSSHLMHLGKSAISPLSYGGGVAERVRLVVQW